MGCLLFGFVSPISQQVITYPASGDGGIPIYSSSAPALPCRLPALRHFLGVPFPIAQSSYEATPLHKIRAYSGEVE